MPGAKTEVALQFSECCAAEVALQHSLFCSAEVVFTKSCAAASEKLQCNIEKAGLQESGAFLPLSCGFQAPTFRHPRLAPADSASIRNPCFFGGFPCRFQKSWAAANGGVTNGGLRGVWPPFRKSAEIGLFRPFSTFSPFSGGCEEHLENPENGGKRPFPQISSDSLKPPSLKPPFAALQKRQGTEFLRSGHFGQHRGDLGRWIAAGSFSKHKGDSS